MTSPLPGSKPPLTPSPASGEAGEGESRASPDRATLLAELRSQIQRIEGFGGEGARTLPFGVDAIDAALPGGGLPLGCLHELAEEAPGTGTAFAAGLLARLASARAPAVWVVRGRDLHAAGLAAYGLTPDRLIAVSAPRAADALWAMEEALRCTSLSAVLAEAGDIGLTASRRLQLAAESSGVTAFLLDRERRRRAGTSAAVSRWRIAAAPSGPEESGPNSSGDGPGVGEVRWRVALDRCRGGRPGEWLLEWRAGRLAEVADRPADSASGSPDSPARPAARPAARPVARPVARRETA